ncbi:MAG: glucan phosphoethanolaminetransferase (alkaline phosphatase superfamily) [Psychroserpens sp.]|jgi:glucan phosphoethanolaminetransferase (alkaline phosphatase superfamily)
MKFAEFLVVITAYFYVCLMIVKLHKYVAEKLKDANRNQFYKLCTQYIWALLFIVTYIPFGIFFPAWLSSKVNLIEHSTNSTAVLILLGSFTLAITMWLGYKKDKRSL